MNNTDILCYSTGIAGRDAQCAHGPMHLVRRFQQQHPTFSVQRNLTCDSNDSGHAALDPISQLNTQLAELTANAVNQNRRFLTLSGDHSSAIGSWSGAARALLAQQQQLGLIWIDAHMDSHTFDTSITSNIHGMPLAALLGHGDKKLTDIGHTVPALQPDHVILIGIRSYEPEERALLEKLNVKVYYVEEVHQRGLHTVLQETLSTLEQRVDRIGISIDIDAVDPADAPGVSTPEPNGIAANELISALPAVCQHPKWLASELTEFLPSQDLDNKTEKLALALLGTLLGVKTSCTTE